MCEPCYQKVKHEHKMEKLGLDLDGERDSSSLSPAEMKRLSIQRCIESLVHACQCRDANCKLAVCEKMKRVVSHTKMCTVSECPLPLGDALWNSVQRVH